MTLNPEDPQPKQVLYDCHADWISDCKWSNMGEFLVNIDITSLNITDLVCCLRVSSEYISAVDRNYHKSILLLTTRAHLFKASLA